MKKTRRWAPLVGAAVLIATSPARAADEPAFGARHRLVVSVDRIAGVTRASLRENSATATTVTSTDFSLLGISPVSMALSASQYEVPRVGIDTFLGDGFSLGASAMFSKLGGPDPTWEVLFAPRAGYALALGSHVVMWPRLGLTYIHVRQSAAGFRETMTLYAATIEVPFVFTIASRAFISFAPTVDLGLGGSGDISAQFGPAPVMPLHMDVKGTAIGVQVALGAYF